MARGRKRKPNPHIPAHIDQSALPRGIYFDSRGSGVWYTIYQDEGGKPHRKNLAGSNITLSELHRLMEDRSCVDRNSLAYLSEQYHNSKKFGGLAQKTQESYCYARDVVLNLPTKSGDSLGKLAVRKFTPALVQRIIDRIAEDGAPSKAAHALRYLRLLMQWGRNRGYVDTNPAQGIEAPKERKQRRLPNPTVMGELTQFARQQGALTRGMKGACAPYLWYVMEISYLCRLRGIETVTLTDAHELPEGVRTNRRKGSRDNIVRWTPRLRAAWEAAKQTRADIWEKKKMPIPLLPEQRRIIVAAHGGALQKSSLDTAWQRLMTLAMEKKILLPHERFGLHDCKRRGITDTAGNRADKQDASGHRDASMLDVYDFSLPVVNTPEQQ